MKNSISPTVSFENGRTTIVFMGTYLGLPKMHYREVIGEVFVDRIEGNIVYLTNGQAV